MTIYILNLLTSAFLGYETDIVRSMNSVLVRYKSILHSKKHLKWTSSVWQLSKFYLQEWLEIGIYFWIQAVKLIFINMYLYIAWNFPIEKSQNAEKNIAYNSTMYHSYVPGRISFYCIHSHFTKVEPYDGSPLLY